LRWEDEFVTFNCIYILIFGVFLVLKHVSKQNISKKKTSNESAEQKGKAKKNISPKLAKKITKSGHGAVKQSVQTKDAVEEDAAISGRPENEIVSYNELEFDLREIISKGTEVLIGPRALTRFERARIIGARSLQLSLGAPFMIVVPADVRDSISLATTELSLKALPISIRRILPNGLYQDIPIDWLK
jgi:DNA-directed RNA polymerases I, II, and III subunit RPABC2